MKFIEISKGVSVEVKSIEGIVRTSETTCEVYTHHNKYASTLSYETILGLVSLKSTEGEEKKTRVLENLDGFLKNVGTFAG